MRKLQEKFKKNFAELWSVIKRDKVYVILMFILVAVASFNLAYRSVISPASEPSASASKSYHQPDYEDMDDFLKDVKTTPLFRKLLVALVTGVFLGTVLLGLNFVRFITKYFFLPREHNPPDLRIFISHRQFCPWSLWDVFKIMIIFFTAYLSFLIIQEIVIELSGVDSDSVNYNFLFVMVMLFSEIVAVFFLFRFMGNYNVSLKKFGLSLSNFFSSVLKGVSGYLMFLPVYIVLVLLTNLISKFLDIKLKPQEVLSLLTDESKFNSSQFIVVILFITVIGPVFEEIFFRGFVYKTLRKYLGVFWGILINGLLFSLIHNNMMAFLPIVFLGIILGVLVEKTSSLVPSIIMHIMVNSVSVVMVVFN